MAQAAQPQSLAFPYTTTVQTKAGHCCGELKWDRYKKSQYEDDHLIGIIVYNYYGMLILVLRDWPSMNEQEK